MNVDVVVETTIARPPHEVAAYAGDPTHAPQWYANIRSVEWRTPPPVAVGSRMDFVAHFLGRRLAYTYEVVELVPGERLVMRTADGPFPMETTYTWEPDGRRHPDDAGQPGSAHRLQGPLGAVDAGGGAARDPQGPGPADGAAGGVDPQVGVDGRAAATSSAIVTMWRSEVISEP